MSLIRGEISIERPINPGPTRINISGEYSADLIRQKVICRGREFDIRPISRLIDALKAGLEKP